MRKVLTNQAENMVSRTMLFDWKTSKAPTSNSKQAFAIQVIRFTETQCMTPTGNACSLKAA